MGARGRGIVGKKLRYITVEEDQINRTIAKKHGIYYVAPKCMLLRDAPKESDAFEYSYQYDEDIKTILN